MRKRYLAAASVLLLVLVAVFTWRLISASGPRADRMKDPAWTSALRNPADLAYFEQAPAYRVELDYEPIKQVLVGTESILFTNTTGQPLATLYLMTAGNAWGQGEEPFRLTDLKVDGRAVTHTQEEFYAEIPLPRALKPGGSTTLTFGFTARIPPFPTLSTGTFDDRTQSPTYGGLSRHAGLSEAIPTVLTDVTPLKTMTALGAIDTPVYALWDVRVTLADPWRIISGGAPVGEETLPDGRKTTRIVSAAHSWPLFVSTAYQSASRDVDGVKLIVHYGVIYEAEGKALLEDAVAALKAHMELLGPYPFTELEIMPVDAGAAFAGLNRSGLIMLASQYYPNRTANPQTAVTDPALRRVLTTSTAVARRELVAHEIAHSWWGDQVWADLLTAPWWIESITEASGIAALEKAFGSEVAARRRDRMVYAYRVMRLSGQPDLHFDPRPTEMTMQYIQGAYYKPAIFYDTLRRQVGDEAFFAAMRRYMDKYRFAVAPGKGPVEELLHRPGVAAHYQRWMMETHGDEDLGLFTPEQMQQLGLAP